VQAGELSENAAQSSEPPILVSTLPATASDKRLALITCLVFLTGLVGSAPFAHMPVAQFPAVVALLQAVQVTADLIIAGLLFAQYRVQRSRELTILAAGFLFTSLIVVAHTLTFPGVISQNGAFRAGPQSAAWLVIGWRIFLPLTVIAYALRQDGKPNANLGGAREPILAASIAVTGGAVVLTLLATLGRDSLPALMNGDFFMSAARLAMLAALTITVAALLVLVHRRSCTVLDLLLMVVMFAWSCADILVCLSDARYSFGCLAARICAVLASTLLLVILLYETTALYARMQAARAEARERQRRLKEIAAVRIETERTVLAVLAKRTSEEANRAKSELIARMSRELRTPITSVLGRADRLFESGLTTEQRLEVTLLRDAGQSLLAKIDDFLGVSKVALASDQISADPPASVEGALDSRARILVAEDDAMIGEIMETILSAAGHEVVLVHNGTEAIATLNASDFDLVLMDVQMPEMDGIAATRRIRELGSSRARNMPIIAVTSFAAPQDVERCRAAGMTDHIAKPFNHDELLRLVAKWSGREHPGTAG
jgi:two-component system sensor histidine kinase/response regulator